MKKLIIKFMFLFSCASKTVEFQDIKTFAVDLEEAKPVLYSSIIDSIVYLKLETVPNSHFGRINKIITISDRIYIHPYDRKSLIVFSKSGKFLFRLYHEGRGPQEYFEITDFAVDPLNGNILIRDCGFDKILTYDANGNFISAINEKGKSNGFIMSVEGFLIFTGNGHMNKGMSYEGYNLYILDKQGNLINKAVKVPSYLEGSYSIQAFSTPDSLIAYHPPYYDSIYHVKGKAVYPAYVFDFGKFRAPYAEALNGLWDLEWDRRIQILNAFHEKYAIIDDFFESSDFIYYTLFLHKQFHIGLINKSTSKQIVTTKLINDIDYGISLNNYTFNFLEGNKLVAVVDAYKIHDFMKSDKIHELKSKFPEKFENLNSLFERTDEMDNPIIIYNYLKSE